MHQSSFFSPLLPGGFNGRRAGRAVGLSFGMFYLLPLAGVVADYEGLRRVLAAVVLLAFVALYYTVALIRDNWLEEPAASAWTPYALFVLLGLASPVMFGRDFAGFPIYLAIVSSVFLPKRWTFPALLLCTGVAFVLCELIGADGMGVLTVTSTTFGLGLMMLAFRHSGELVQQLRAARAEVARLAAAEERLRIARDLHDLLGHSLSLIVLKSELAVRMSERDPARAAQEMRDVNKVAAGALRDVRETVTGYRQRTLAEELDSARDVLTAAGVEPVVRLSGTPDDAGREALFAWAVRECVTNVVRHARARRCEITVSPSLLEVADDGVAQAQITEGNGLGGLRERVAEFDGTVHAAPRSSGGLLVRVSL